MSSLMSALKVARIEFLYRPALQFMKEIRNLDPSARIEFRDGMAAKCASHIGFCMTDKEQAHHAPHTPDR
jgi:hypothetical protein